MNNWIFEAAEVNELDINELPSGNTRSTRGGGGGHLELGTEEALEVSQNL